ncbi:MAG: PilT/PilU family type 4a pilus ATPase [Pseudohongiellaceae bacterium]
MDIVPYLKLMAEKEASDLFFSVGAPVSIKINGLTQPLNQEPLSDGEVEKLVHAITTEAQRSSFAETLELNFSHALEGVGRYRVNVYRQRGDVAMVVRYIKTRIPTIAELQMPPILADLVMEPRGLVLVVGATGSGKSTTLASMIDHRNIHQSGHILTIEDPIEFMHSHKKSVVDQREVGLDTLSYASALKNAMREAPDVILIGEIRDRETMQHAIAYAETGHLCLSTLHANNANQAIDRIINFFPDTAHHQLRVDLSMNLRAVISQRLVKGIDNKLVPAVEIMLRTPYISDLIERGEIDLLKDSIAKGRDGGMQTFDQSLFDLWKSGKISAEQTLANADSRNNLSVQMRLAKGAGAGKDNLTMDESQY